MTRFIPRRFRRLLVTLGVLAGAGGLTLGLAGAASAATAWNGPSPSPTPTVSYTPAPRHHRPPPPVTHCFLSLETEHDTLAGQPVGQQGYGPQSYTAPAYGQPQGKHEPTIEVVQLVKVCVTEQRGRPDQVRVWDVTGPFAWEVPASGPEPTPTGLPDNIAGMLAA
jgi:hypothetical protein